MAEKKIASKLKKHARSIMQIGYFAVTNGYLPGYYGGNFYSGGLKSVCVPGLNCYSCPGALGSCPIGALQAVAGHRAFSFSLYAAGLIVLFGALLGRFICGWLCPFGALQGLIFKIPFIKKIRRVPGDRILRRLKYVILILFVLLLPALVADVIGQGIPWFCKYICPSGTLFGGIWWVTLDEGIRSAAGWLFVFKTAVLAAIVILSLIVYRPFCRYLCPLGALYGMFNAFSLYGYELDKSKCVGCGRCSRICPMGLDISNMPDSAECIRCGKCVGACTEGALKKRFGFKFK